MAATTGISIVVNQNGRNVGRAALGGGGAPVKFKALPEVKYLLRGDGDAGPERVTLTRVGNDLHLTLEGEARPALVLEDYFSLAQPSVIYGVGGDGQLHPYGGTDAAGGIFSLADGASVPATLAGGGAHGEPGRETAALPLWPLWAGIGGIAAAGIAATAGGGGGSVVSREAATADPSPSPSPSPDSGATESKSSPPARDILQVIDDQGPFTGLVANGGLTDDARPELVGQGEPGNLITVRDNGIVIGSAVVDDSGNWRFIPLADLADGRHSIAVTESIPGGEEGASSAAWSFEVDTGKPGIPTIEAALEDQADSSVRALSSGDPTNDGTPTLSGHAEAGSTVTVYDNGRLLGTAQAAGDGNWHFTPAAPLEEGRHEFTVSARDAAGNAGGSSDPFVLSIDYTPPAATITIEGISDDTGTPGDFITSDDTLTVHGRLSAALAADERVQISIDGGASWIDVPVTAGSQDWSYADARTLPVGDHTYAVRVIDLAGNVNPTGGSASQIVTVVPSASNGISIDGITDDTGIPGDFVTADDTLTVHGKLSSALAAGSKVQIQRDGGAWVDVSDVNGVDWSYADPSALPEGAHVYAVRVIDASMAELGRATQGVTVDRTPPTATITIDGIIDDTGTPGDFITTDATLTVYGRLSTALAADERVQISVDGGATWIDVPVAAGSQDWSYADARTLPAGDHTFAVRVIDLAGNVNPAGGSESQVVTVVPAAPLNSITIDGISDDTGLAADFITADDTLMVHGNLGSVLAAGTKIQIQRDGGTWIDVTDVSGTEWSYADPDALPEGKHTYAVRVVDASMAELGSATQEVTVDQTPPAATITIDGISDDTGTPGDFITSDNTLTVYGRLSAALAADEHVQISVDGGFTWIDVPLAAGSQNWSYVDPRVLPVGDHTYEVRVIDLACNVNPAGGRESQVVTVVDSMPTPGIGITINGITDDTGVPGDFVTSDDTLTVYGSLDTTLSAGQKIQIQRDGGAWIEVSDVNGVNWSYADPSTLPEGKHNYAVRVVDASMAELGSATQEVTVDKRVPSISIDGITEDTGTPGDFITTDTTLTIYGSLGAPMVERGWVRISVDGGATSIDVPVAAGSQEWSYSDPRTLSAGEHTYTVFLYYWNGDMYVAVGMDSQVVTVIDAPSSNSIGINGITDDTGLHGTDFVTQDDTLTVHGSLGSALAAGTKVQIQRDGGIWVDVTDVLGTGWSYTDPNVLSEGKHTYAVRMVDASMTELGSAAQDVTIDQTPPAATITIDGITDDTGTPGDFITSDNTLTVYGKLSAALATDERVQVSVDGGATWIDVPLAAGSQDWSYADPRMLPTGDHTYEVRVIDLAGNVNPAGGSASQRVVIDTDAPQQTVAITNYEDDAGPSQGVFDNLGQPATDDTTPKLIGSLSAPLADGERVAIYRDGSPNPVGYATDSGSGGWYFQETSALAPGNHVYTARVVDQAGNAGPESSGWALQVQTEGLDGKIVLDLATASDNGFDSTDNVTSVISPVINGTITGLKNAYAIWSSDLTATLFDDVNHNGILDAGDTVFGSRIGLTVEDANSASFSFTMPMMKSGSYDLKAVLVDGSSGQHSEAGLLDGSQSARLVIDPSTPTLGIGRQENDGLGWMLDGIGDFNGDGIEDFIVSAPHTLTDHWGSDGNDSDIYLVYGTAQGLPQLMDMDDLVASGQGIHLNGKGFNLGEIGKAGMVVKGIGDINGDGRDDIVVASEYEGAYVIFGRSSGMGMQEIDLSDMKNGASFTGFRIDGGIGWYAVAGGDVNGDGYADLIISDSATSWVSVLYGHDDKTSWDNLVMSKTGLQTYYPRLGVAVDMPAGAQTTFTVSNGAGGLGSKVQVVGDVNGDGLQDFVITDAMADTDKGITGVAYLVFGKAGGYSALQLNQDYASVGIRISGAEDFEHLGDMNPWIRSAESTAHGGTRYGTSDTIAAIGDINGDGIADFAIGSPLWGDDFDGPPNDGLAAGRVYVIYGKQGGWSDFSLNDMDGASRGFYLSASIGSDALLGNGVRGAGDVNGDGIDDFLIGAPNADSNGKTDNGAVYLVYGRIGGYDLFNDLDGMVAMGTARKWVGAEDGDHMGTNVGMGDWNGDGLQDIAIPSWGSDLGAPNGGAYAVYYGDVDGLTRGYTKDGDWVELEWWAPSSGARVSGGLGDDVIQGVGSGDVVYAGAGNDSVGIVNADFTRVDGGLGIDTLILQGSGMHIDLSALGLKVQGFERFDLGYFDNTLSLRTSDVVAQGSRFNYSAQGLEDKTRVLVSGSSSGKVELLGGDSGPEGWHDGGKVVNGYHIYSNATDTAELWVQSQVQVAIM